MADAFLALIEAVLFIMVTFFQSFLDHFEARFDDLFVALLMVLAGMSNGQSLDPFGPRGRSRSIPRLTGLESLDYNGIANGFLEVNLYGNRREMLVDYSNRPWIIPICRLFARNIVIQRLSDRLLRSPSIPNPD